ncbi:ROK family protein [Salegentibacter sp. Hel_I_6]|uniref:ROK family protein n=1 Tax=Salegentibacter sp. Hel_I_6 TaxID=1250278 RepID=UPI0006896924|nr:ROK family protein [Salegentibacter sp. Hel_I_6]
MYSIGVDIGGSHITSCMYEHSNNKLNSKTLVHSKVDTKASKEEILKIWIYTISKTIELAQVPIKGVGLAMPGPFDYFEGISLISKVDKFESLYRVNIRLELAKSLHIEPSEIRFINDATAFSITEALIGQATNHKRSIAITLGTGFGSSFLVNGQPIMDGKNVPQGGFLYDKWHEGHLADDLFSTRGIIKKYKELSGREVMNVKELYERSARDRNAKKVFQCFGTELGKFLKPYIVDFESSIIVLGGNIAKAFAHFEEELLLELPEVKVCVSNFGEEAAIIGSALLLDDIYYEDLKPCLKLM